MSLCQRENEVVPKRILMWTAADEQETDTKIKQIYVVER